MQNKPSLELLFAQLGLANSPAAIELYVRTHQLPATVSLHDAAFWNKGQRALLISHLVQDDDWAIWLMNSINNCIWMPTNYKLHKKMPQLRHFL